MKNILDAPFIRELGKTASNMYRLGWDERNGGNISVILENDEAAEYLDLNGTLRKIPLSFDAAPLEGKILLVTGTGKYFKNIEDDPEKNLGILKITGAGADLLWGYSDGGAPTSELPAHLMSHASRLAADPDNRVVMHSHPTNTLALTRVIELDEKKITRALWKTCTECIIVFPDGVGVLPWMVCGTEEIGIATAEKMKRYRLVIWGQHGIYGCGGDLDEAFGLIETVEKAALLYLTTANLPIINEIRDSELRAVAEAFGLAFREDFLGE